MRFEFVVVILVSEFTHCAQNFVVLWNQRNPRKLVFNEKTEFPVSVFPILTSSEYYYRNAKCIPN